MTSTGWGRCGRPCKGQRGRRRGRQVTDGGAVCDGDSGDVGCRVQRSRTVCDDVWVTDGVTVRNVDGVEDRVEDGNRGGVTDGVCVRVAIIELHADLGQLAECLEYAGD